MKMLIFVALAAVLVGLSCWFFFTDRKAPSLPAPLLLPNGTTVRVLAVTYGTNHAIGSKIAGAAADLPMVFQNLLKRILGRNAVPAQSLTTPTPELVVWLDHQTNSASATAFMGGYFEAYLGDGSNFISGPAAMLSSFAISPNSESLQFGAFPRRDPRINLSIFYHDAMGKPHFCGHLSFANPQYRTYPQWQAPTLPATKRVGDLEVTLRSVETGHGDGSTVRARRDGSTVVAYDTDREDGRNLTGLDLSLRPLKNTNEVWQVAGVDVSDATGNSAHSMSMSWSGNTAAFSFSPSLWPGEAAWKLKLEVKRTEGFRAEEIFAFKNVPLGELDRTNTLAWTTNASGITLTLRDICRRAPWTNNSWSSSQLSSVRFKHSALPAGTQVDLLWVVFDTGKTNRSESWSSSSNEREYDFRAIPLEARTADIVFAVQQSRTVEFTVKPEVAKPNQKAEK
jgi:hypothetical protein